MHRTRSTLLLAPVSFLLFVQVASAAKGAAPPTEPGTYTDWNNEIDRLEIVETFRRADFARVRVDSFSTDGVALPDSDDNAREPVLRVLSDVKGPFVEGMREVGRLDLEIASGDDVSDSGTLLVRGRVLEMDPGSRAARYWAGFGAGAARTKVEAEVVDAASGRVLLRFTQERRSGVGRGGGRYDNLLQRNLRTIGEDLAAALAEF